MENKKKGLIQFAIFTVTFAVAFFVARLVFSQNTHDKLQEMADTFNAKTPVMIDTNTRLDHVEAFGDTLQYNYTLVHVSRQDSTTDITGAKAFLMKKSQANLDSSPEMKSFRDENISLKYHYRDKAGADLLEFKINPTQAK